MSVMLDTDHCVAVLRGSLNIDKYVEPTTTLFVSAITVCELVYGALKSDRPEHHLGQVDLLLEGTTVLAFDKFEARRCGILKDELRRQGLLIAEPDLQIASIALENALPLATHNQRHFARIPGLSLLDWIL
ncbi:MAG: type II toxin-antitoxin system VapC family toxin [Anaerolineales bacterium]|nr:type II toxin-antitoxin system VapC family toxin [Anaerolineales bacterium]